ncbi:response regulator transcription factor [Stenotrophomonas indicatrix]|uniref:response regulator transcription factor n=1 Tax=Stenotrophomonas indicatrix TaxID=2045451 RepID=UPI00300A6611
MSTINIRVVIADDHPVIRLGVQIALAEAPAVTYLGAASDAGGLLQLLQQLPCDVIITDYAMPSSGQQDGLYLIQLLRQRFPALGIVVLTGLDQLPVILALEASGVQNIVSKADNMQHVVAAVMACYARRRYHSPQIAALLKRLPPAPPLGRLSKREQQVIGLYAQGMNISDIAAHLGLKKQTVSTQKIKAMQKLGAQNDAQLFTYAAELGLAHLTPTPKD